MSGMGKASRIRLLIVDDHPVFRDGPAAPRLGRCKPPPNAPKRSRNLMMSWRIGWASGSGAADGDKIRESDDARWHTGRSTVDACDGRPADGPLL